VALLVDRACKILVEECAHVQRGEELLILADELQTHEMKRIKKILDVSHFIEIYSPRGTHLHVQMANRPTMLALGSVRKP